MLTIPPDLSFVVQIISFVVLFAGLKHLIFDPTLRVIEERERRTQGAKHSAAELRAESEQQAAEYEAKMRQVRSELNSTTESARAEIETEERRILDAAREQTGTELAQLRDQLTEQANAARPQLADEARELAKRMFEQVVGESKRMKALRWVPAAVFVLLADIARASEESHHGGGEEHHAGIPWLTLAFSTFNFLLFCYVIGRFVAPSVRTWLRQRHDRIVADLQAAAAAKAEALRMRDEWQARTAQLSSSIEEMRVQAQKDAERERDRIIAAAEKAAEAIRKDAERSAAYQVRRTQELLRTELTKAALQQAEEQVRTKWTAEDQMRFVADFLAQVQS